MITLNRSGLDAMAATRPAGFAPAVLAAAQAEGDLLHLDDAAWRTIQSAYLPAIPPMQRRGLGDLVAAVAQPIARTLDRAIGTNLANCGGCKKRQEALNRIGR